MAVRRVVVFALLTGCAAQKATPLAAPSPDAPSSSPSTSSSSPRAPGPAPLVAPRADVVEIWMAGGLCARFQNGSVQCAILQRNAGEPWRPHGEPRPELGAVAGVAGLCAWRADGTMFCPHGRECSADFVARTKSSDCAWPEQLRDVELAMASGQLCARLHDGAVRCADPNVKELVSIPSAKNARALRGTHWESCALLPTGGIDCWPTGNRWSDESSRQPPEARRPYQPVPAPVERIDGAVAFDLDDDHGCAVLRDGTIRCWGENFAGQLGGGALGERSYPVAVRGLKDAAEVRVSASRSCARLHDGTVHCWGANEWGEIDRTGLARPTPVRIPHLAHAKQIAMQGSTTCALLENHGVVCWGCAMAPRCGLGLTDEVVRREKEAARKACGEPTTIAWAP